MTEIDDKIKRMLKIQKETENFSSRLYGFFLEFDEAEDLSPDEMEEVLLLSTAKALELYRKNRKQKEAELYKTSKTEKMKTNRK